MGEQVVTKDTSLEIAARIWCDQEMRFRTMEPKLAEEIAQLIFNKYGDVGDDWEDKS